VKILARSRGQFERTRLQGPEVKEVIAPREINELSNPNLAGGLNRLAARL